MRTVTVRVNVILMIISTVMKVTRPLCTPPDITWRGYVPTPAPVEFDGTPTACAHNNCPGPIGRQIGFASRLADGDYGPNTLNVNAVHAWNTNVTIVFILNSNVQVQGINLYFYNIPSWNIGLPYDTVLLSVASFIEGNQDLSQSDNQLRNVTLIPTSLLSGTIFTIQFNFSNIDKIDWLLLTEVEICTIIIGTIIPQPRHISFIANRMTTTCTNSAISLSCSVENEGRFTWSWTLPSGDTRPSTFILDTGRTSVLELSQISSNDNGVYQCHVNYSQLLNFQKFPEATINNTLTTEDCITSPAHSTPTSDTTSTPTSDTTSTPTSTTPLVDHTTTNTLITCSTVAASIAPFVGSSILGFLVGLGVGLLLMGVITVCIVKKIKSRQVSIQPKAAAGPIYEDVDDCKEQIGLQTKTNEAYGMVTSSH